MSFTLCARDVLECHSRTYSDESLEEQTINANAVNRGHASEVSEGNKNSIGNQTRVLVFHYNEGTLYYKLLMAYYKLAVNLENSRATQDSEALAYVNLPPATQRMEVMTKKVPAK